MLFHKISRGINESIKKILKITLKSPKDLKYNFLFQQNYLEINIYKR